MEIWLTAILALAAGLAGGILFSQRKLREAQLESTRTQAELDATQKAHESEKEFEKEAKDSLQHTFEALAKRALSSNSEEFLKSSGLQMEPLKEALKELNTKNTEMERKRAEAYGSLETQVKGLLDATQGLSQRSENLIAVLRGSNQARGNWGEMMLRNVVECAGMEKHVNYLEQFTTDDGQRPDMVISLPGEGLIPVDSKCPFNAWEEASRAEDKATQDAHMLNHANAVRHHVKAFKGKDYAASLGGKVDFTVMFMPGDHLLADALRADPSLQEDAMKMKVLLATPMTLVALLRTVGVYWQQEATEKNAQEITKAASELVQRVGKLMEHHGKIGRGLQQARDAYNDSVGSYEKRILPSAKKIKQLQGKTDSTPGLDSGKLPTVVEGNLKALPGAEEAS
ncbi:MAG: DNA recombination protein RmuC [Planctomycetes bacterium]|nr:DNA recombination protein RmuC [Planctomycetota bacterium]